MSDGQKLSPEVIARARSAFAEREDAMRKEILARTNKMLAEGFNYPDMSPEAIDARLMLVFELLDTCLSLAGDDAEYDETVLQEHSRSDR